MITGRNNDIAKFGNHPERQIPLNVYADRREPRTSNRPVEKKIHGHVKEFTRKFKGDKKNHKKREPGSGLSSSHSKKARAMRRRVPKFSNFAAIIECFPAPYEESPGELTLSIVQNATSSALQVSLPQGDTNTVKRAS